MCNEIGRSESGLNSIDRGGSSRSYFRIVRAAIPPPWKTKSWSQRGIPQGPSYLPPLLPLLLRSTSAPSLAPWERLVCLRGGREPFPLPPPSRGLALRILLRGR